MSHAALDAYLDYGEGYPDCPACGDNSYVYQAPATDLLTGEEYDNGTLLSCDFCRDPTFFFVDNDGGVVAVAPDCPCCGSSYTGVIPKQLPAVSDESTLFGCEDCSAIFWLDDGDYVSG